MMLIYEYALILLTSFLGLIIGIIISNMAVEEIDKAKKYLTFLNIFIVPTTMAIAISNINVTGALILAIILLVALLILRGKYGDALLYSCMGAIFYASSLGHQMSVVATLIFIYGVSISTTEASNHFKKKINGKVTAKENYSLVKKILMKYGCYLIIGIVFYAVFTYLV